MIVDLEFTFVTLMLIDRFGPINNRYYECIGLISIELMELS